MKITFIAWIHFHRRTELLAQHLGASLHFIQYGQLENLIQAPFRYVAQAAKSWLILKKEQPAIILVQNPPLFCALVAYCYARRYGAQYAIDSHTGAFVGRRWRWLLWLHRLLSQRALITIVHNKSQAKIVEKWACPYLVLAFTPGNYSCADPLYLSSRFKVAVISSFRADERPEIVFEAASCLPEVDFYFSGSSEHLTRNILAQKPENCHLMGYLPYRQYVGLLQGVDAIMVLTTRNHTLLMGGFEAVSIGKPLITSNWPVLKDYFSSGAVHIPYTKEGIYRGVCQVQANYDALRQGMATLRTLLGQEWQQNLQELKEILGITNAPSAEAPSDTRYKNKILIQEK